MILTVARVMTLSLMRDRGALAMSFLLPPAMFLVFAAIFADTGDAELDLATGIAGAPPELVAALGAPRTYADAEALRRAVAEGAIDAGVFVTGPLDRTDAAPVTIFVDPGKTVAGAVLEGRLVQAVAEALPQVMARRQAAEFAAMAGPLTPAQITRLSAPPESRPTGLTRRELVGSAAAVDPDVSYYAGAITVMFLLFSASSAATTLIDERESGVLDRFAAGPAGIDPAVTGKALFLTGLGTAQALIVFSVAALAHGVPLFAAPLHWLIASVLVAAAAAGFGLLVAAACRSRAQSVAVSNFLILVLSAIGGSMVPRFLMPDWLRQIGAISPNAWAVELYQGLLYRGQGLGDFPGQIAALAALALIGTGVAVLLTRRRMLL
ncbi:ABC transporter permease [Roseobacter sp. HKCCA0434]|uniref:ABC transporter permease n=1 Tax=Roseobacter sp. HKCCA0434 TaxID=3079297 RepID=UPI00290592A2|nr:ABC transporter permease [Roseobacter sp. HKCCA0434]